MPGATKQSHENTGNLAKNTSQDISIGYLGSINDTSADINENDPNLQKFSIGEAIYYIKKKAR